MAKMSLNLTNTDLPEGDHLCRILKVENKMSKASNQPMLAFTLQPLDDEYKNIRLFRNYSLQENALPIFKNQILVPFEFVDHDAEGDVEFDPDELVGVECIATTEHREFQGRRQNNVVSIAPNAKGW